MRQAHSDALHVAPCLGLGCQGDWISPAVSEVQAAFVTTLATNVWQHDDSGGRFASPFPWPSSINLAHDLLSPTDRVCYAADRCRDSRPHCRTERAFAWQGCWPLSTERVCALHPRPRVYRFRLVFAYAECYVLGQRGTRHEREVFQQLRTVPVSARISSTCRHVRHL